MEKCKQANSPSDNEEKEVLIVTMKQMLKVTKWLKTKDQG
jgi:hypothetical protein